MVFRKHCRSWSHWAKEGCKTNIVRENRASIKSRNTHCTGGAEIKNAIHTEIQGFLGQQAGRSFRGRLPPGDHFGYYSYLKCFNPKISQRKLPVKILKPREHILAFFHHSISQTIILTNYIFPLKKVSGSKQNL